MKLRHLKIQSFRGIKSLDWFPQGDFICLIGAGDSGKSTVLDAIELVFSPRWNPNLDDSDFYMGDTTANPSIEATIGELPRRLLSDALFGLRLRGFLRSVPVVHDEPEDGDEEVLTIRFSFDASLEPRWEIVTDRHQDGAALHVREREKLGLTRLGGVLDRHFSWGRGSILSRLTGDLDDHASILTAAARNARLTVNSSSMPSMESAASTAASLSAPFGVKPRDGFQPGVDAAVGFGSGGLALHDGSVPVRRAGLGTRRLLTLALQRRAVREGGIILVDEIEQGLEPYRLRQLLRVLLAGSKNSDESSDEEVQPGCFLTTHSPTTLSQLRCEQLRVVRRDGGNGGMQILKPAAELQGTLIAHAEAFLSHRVIVCEGMTELGLLLGLDASTDDPLAFRGVGLCHGGGNTKVAEVAVQFRSLGYDTALIADSDAPLTKTTQELLTEGIHLIVWAGSVCTEQRLFLDLPWEAVARAVEIPLDEGLPVREHLAAALEKSVADLPEAPIEWRSVFEEASLRDALGRASVSKKAPWFKNARSGDKLGQIVANNLDKVAETDLGKKLGLLRNWIES